MKQPFIIHFIKKQNLAVLIFLLFCGTFGFSQKYCGTEVSGSNLDLLSLPCINMDIDEVPIKTIRVTFHIFQKDDGSGNIQNDSEGNNYLDDIAWSMNHYMINLPMFDYTTSSPYYTDSKIRYEVVDTHFWKNTEMWKKGNYKTSAKGDSLYDFIMSQPIPYKTTSVHLFMPGNFPGIEQDFGGVACGLQCNKWSTAIGVYYKFINSSPSNRNHWDPAKVFRHELGHNFGLHHTFHHSENCSDTPPLNVWSTNNMMDYGSQQSLTQCQLSQMHKWLETNTDIVKSGLPDYSISGQVEWSGGGTALNNSNFVPERDIEVEINAPGEAYFTWTKTGGSGQWWANAGGSFAEIDIGSTNQIVFKVETEANCNEITEYFDFNYTGSFYNIYPNPMGQMLHVEINKENHTYSSSINFNNTSHQIKIYDQYKSLKLQKNLNMDSGSHHINTSGLQNGLYFIELQNQHFSKVFKMQKL